METVPIICKFKSGLWHPKPDRLLGGPRFKDGVPPTAQARSRARACANRSAR